MLLTMTDGEFAAATGRTAGAASSRRRKLGRPNSHRTFGPGGARVSPGAAEALTNCVNALQRVVTDAAVAVARVRDDAAGDPPVIRPADVAVVRGELFAALRRGCDDRCQGGAAAVVRGAVDESAGTKPEGDPPRPVRVPDVGI